MKLATKSDTAIVSTAKDRFKFRIGDSEAAQLKAFWVFTDSLYGDKIGSIIRELSCNAADAHIQSGNKSPIEITLPSLSDQTFTVKDYGPGLSREDVENLYCTLFESNKTDDDEATGCLGLGSKSPFCYTPSFLIESRHNGTTTIYSVNRGNGGFPEVDVISSRKVSEPSGMTIRVPTKRYDSYEFQNKVESLKYFNVPVKVNGKLIDKPKYDIEFGKYKVHGVGGSAVIMGGVRYPIDTDKFNSSAGVIETMSGGVDFYVDMGTVQFNPGRESLSYSDMTVRTIIAHANEFSKLYATEVNKKIDSLSSLFEARTKYNNYCKYGVTGKMLKYRGTPLIDDTFNGNTFRPSYFDLKIDTPDYSIIGPDYSKCIIINRGMNGIRIPADCIFYELDTPNNFKGKFLEKHCLPRYSYNTTTNGYVIKGDIKKFQQELQLPDSMFSKTSLLPDIAPTSVRHGKKLVKHDISVVNATFVTSNFGGPAIYSTVWSEVDVNKDDYDPDFLVMGSRFNCLGPDGKYISSNRLGLIVSTLNIPCYRTWNKDAEFTFWESAQKKLDEMRKCDQEVMESYNLIKDEVQPWLYDINNKKIKQFLERISIAKNNLYRVVDRFSIYSGMSPSKYEFTIGNLNPEELWKNLKQDFPLLGCVKDSVSDTELNELKRILED